jgi:deoxyribodipyrimidine photolyase-related protein
MARNESKLRGNQRMPYVYATWEKMGQEKQNAIRKQAKDVLERMQHNTL